MAKHLGEPSPGALYPTLHLICTQVSAVSPCPAGVGMWGGSVGLRLGSVHMCGEG